MLSDRQLLTLQHIKDIYGIEKPIEIIEYCVKKINQPKKISYTKHFNAPRVQRRRHGRKYYQKIIDYLAQGGKI